MSDRLAPDRTKAESEFLSSMGVDDYELAELTHTAES